jgi:hypothetical protein
LVEVELFVWEEPPLEALDVVELLVDAPSVPPGWVEDVDPVEVVVPADDPEFDPVCEDPEAAVVVEAVPVPVGVGVGVTVPWGL